MLFFFLDLKGFYVVLQDIFLQILKIFFFFKKNEEVICFPMCFFLFHGDSKFKLKDLGKTGIFFLFKPLKTPFFLIFVEI